MKAIKITEERQNEILPQNIKETDVLSDNAKKTLATIMNYYLLLEEVKANGYVFLNNDTLRQSVGIKKNYVLPAVQELIESGLIERQVGKRRTEGEKATASVYKVIWENLTKPIKKKNTFEELFSEFLKSSGNPLGTTVTDTVSVTDTETVSDIVEETDTFSEIVEVSDEDKEKGIAENDVDAELVIDNEVEIKKEFEVACGVQVEENEDIPREVINEYLQLKEHPEEEDLSKYLKRIEGIKALEAEYPQLKEKKLVYSNTF